MESSSAALLSQLKSQLIRRTYALGPIRLAVYVPDARYPALAHLGDPLAVDRTDYELVFVEFDTISLELQRTLMTFRDASFRAEQFERGFYLTLHYGPAATKITVDVQSTIHVVAGRGIHKTFWAFYAKFFISHYAKLHGMLHLKAAAVIDRRGRAVLIVGKGSGGKSVLAHQLIRNGMRFLSNTHVLVQGDRVFGIDTAIRIRMGGGMLDTLPPDCKILRYGESNEYLVLPRSLFGNKLPTEGRLGAILISNFGQMHRGIYPVAAPTLHTVLLNFSWAMHTYGMKDDYLEIAGGDITAFSDFYAAECRSVRRIADSIPGLYCNLNGAESPPAVIDWIERCE